MNTENILEQAKKLSPAERITLISAIANTLLPKDQMNEILWKEEVEKRYDNIFDGNSKTFTLKEAQEQWKS